MASIIQRRKAGIDYYYLYHDSRGGSRRQYEKYLGSSMPPDIDKRKGNFMLRILRGKWEPKLEIIRSGLARKRAFIPQTILEKNLDAFAVRFTYNTQRMDGSTLSLKDTALLLADGIIPAGRPIVDVLEAEAPRTVFLDAIKEGYMTRNRVMERHRRLFECTKKDIAGKIRNHNVTVRRSGLVPPSHNAAGMPVGEFFEWYETSKGNLNPVDLAALVRLKFVTIRPFGDGNGRISGLMMNHVLHRSGYLMLDIKHGDRRSYYAALARSQTEDVDRPFLRWFMRRYLRMHANCLRHGGSHQYPHARPPAKPPWALFEAAISSPNKTS